MAQSEREFQAAVIEYAQLNGWMVAHFRPGMMKSGRWVTPMIGDPGFPDLVMVRHGFLVFAELKSETGKMSKPQEMWQEALIDAEENAERAWETPSRSGSYFEPVQYSLWRPSDWDEIEQTLRRRT